MNDILFGDIDEIKNTKASYVNSIFANKLPWQVKWAPKTRDDLIIPKSIRSKFDYQMSTTGLKNCTFHGSPGMGKTTLAKMLATEMNAPMKFFNASQMKIDVLREEILPYSKQYMVGSPVVVILDECDKANSELFWNALRSTIDETIDCVRFILTGNYIYNIPEPILSRCKPLSFEHTDPAIKKDIYSRLKHIAKIETEQSGGTFDEETLKQIARKCYPDIRLMINSMEDVFDRNNGSIIGDAVISSELHYSELYKYLAAGCDIEARMYFNEKITDYSNFFIDFCNYFERNVKVGQQTRLIIANAFAEFNFRASQGVNQEINITKGLFTHIIWALKNDTQSV